MSGKVEEMKRLETSEVLQLSRYQMWLRPHEGEVIREIGTFLVC